MRNLRGGDIASSRHLHRLRHLSGGASIDVVDESGMRALGDALQNDAMTTYKDATHTP